MASVSNPISAELERLRREQARHTASTGPPPEPPPQRGFRRRGELKREVALVQAERTYLSLGEARTQIKAELKEFAMSDAPYMLLVAAPPGVGKTTFGVELAEKFAAAGKRVLYCGPRLDFFADILHIAKRPLWWQVWHSRGHKDADGMLDMCRRAYHMDRWLARGYQGMGFCANPKICGWEYVNNGCPYHAQKATRAPIIFGQHAHLTLGHPLMETFDVIIGDENPFQAFQRHWFFDAKYIVPGEMDIREPVTEIVHEMRSLAEREVHAEGPDLLNLLGGAARVREACEMFVMPADAVAEPPNLRRAEDVDEAPYFHLPQLVALLKEESAAAEAGRSYPPRVALAKGKLHLLLRYNVNERATERIVWLDGTANQRLYEAMFKRPVAVVAPDVALQGKIYQVWPRTNGKSSLLKDDAPTTKATQLQQQVHRIVQKYGYTNPAIVTLKDLESLFTGKRAHFYGLRGTNQFKDCDAVIIAGTPQPARPELHTQARMLFAERMRAFDQTWSDRDVPYAYAEADGNGRSYPVGGFWADEDLQALLWQQREAEIIQAAHRARPVLRQVDIWLLTNLPIDELPPTELLSIADLFDAPDSVNAYRWLDVLVLADEFYQAGRPLRSVDVVNRVDVSAPTARHYLKCLMEQQEGRWLEESVLVPNKAGKVGRPARALVPQALITSVSKDLLKAT